MGPFASRCFVAFDALSVAGAVVARKLGRPVVRSFASEALPPGAVNPLPAERNIASPEVVRGAVRVVADALGLGSARVSVMLPDGVARILLLDVPGGVTPLEYAHYRFASSLPYPASDAVIDGVPLPGGRFLAAAVRRSVVEEYEEALSSLSLVPEGLDLSPLAAVSALVKPPAHAGTVDLILGDAAFSLAVHGPDGLRAFRSRRRDPGPDEMMRLRDETRRTLALGGNGGEPRIRVVGSGAGAAIRALAALGSAAEAGWSLDGAGPSLGGAEHAWLGGALA